MKEHERENILKNLEKRSKYRKKKKKTGTK